MDYTRPYIVDGALELILFIVYASYSYSKADPDVYIIQTDVSFITNRILEFQNEWIWENERMREFDDHLYMDEESPSYSAKKFLK